MRAEGTGGHADQCGRGAQGEKQSVHGLASLRSDSGELGGSASDGQRTGRLSRANGAPAERGMEGFGNDREVGQFGHGGDCSRVNACARLSRPREAGH